MKFESNVRLSRVQILVRLEEISIVVLTRALPFVLWVVAMQLKPFPLAVARCWWCPPYVPAGAHMEILAAR